MALLNSSCSKKSKYHHCLCFDHAKRIIILVTTYRRHIDLSRHLFEKVDLNFFQKIKNWKSSWAQKLQLKNLINKSANHSERKESQSPDRRNRCSSSNSASSFFLFVSIQKCKKIVIFDLNNDH